ncbi:unnamed protein product, partial [Pelagomonas calceolata]
CTCSQLTRLGGEEGRGLSLLLRGRPVRGLREDLVADPDLALLDDAGEPAALPGPGVLPERAVPRREAVRQPRRLARPPGPPRLRRREPPPERGQVRARLVELGDDAPDAADGQPHAHGERQRVLAADAPPGHVVAPEAGLDEAAEALANGRAQERQRATVALVAHDVPGSFWGFSFVGVHVLAAVQGLAARRGHAQRIILGLVGAFFIFDLLAAAQDLDAPEEPPVRLHWQIDATPPVVHTQCKMARAEIGRTIFKKYLCWISAAMRSKNTRAEAARTWTRC